MSNFDYEALGLTAMHKMQPILNNDYEQIKDLRAFLSDLFGFDDIQHKEKILYFSDKDKGKDECKYHSGIITKLKYYTGTIPDNNLEILKTVIEKGMFEEIKIITSVLDTLHANPSKRYKQYQENCIIGLMHCDKEDKEDRDLETFPNMFTITGWKHESSN